jgi:pimeloyl-ACP methyl ester carboxylesterase
VTQPRTFDPDARAIAYVDDGDGPALVLIPARGAGIASLETLARIVIDEGFRIVRIDTRREAEQATADALAQDVLDVLDHLGIEHAWVGGHAFGGEIARIAAWGHTDRVNGILLLSLEPSWEGSSEGLPPGVPVLIVHGTEDEISPLERAEQLQASAQDRATLVAIEGGGHDFPTTHPGQAAFAIAEYLDWD